jgi:hypothetical protein
MINRRLRVFSRIVAYFSQPEVRFFCRQLSGVWKFIIRGILIYVLVTLKHIAITLSLIQIKLDKIMVC